MSEETKTMDQQQKARFIQEASRIGLLARSHKMSPLLTDEDKALIKRLVGVVTRAKASPEASPLPIMAIRKELAGVTESAVQEMRAAPAGEVERRTGRARLLGELFVQSNGLQEQVAEFAPEPEAEPEEEATEPVSEGEAADAPGEGAAA